MHKILNRTYFQLTTVLLTGILMLSTVSTGLSHLRCLVEDHQMCDMHAGARGNNSSSPQSADEYLSANPNCNHSNSESFIDLLGIQTDTSGEDCLCYIQAEIKSKIKVKPTVAYKLIGKTVLRVESIIADSIFRSSKPFLFKKDLNAADYPTVAVYLVNTSFII